MELKIKCNKTTRINCRVIFLIAIVSILYSQFFLKGEWQGTPKSILSYVMGREITKYDSTTISAIFFRMINIFSLETMLSWRIYLESIFNFLLYLYCINNEKVYNKKEYLYLFFSTFIIDVFSIQLGKEVVQILVFVIALIIVKSRIRGEITKVLFISGLFILESFHFREYYILVACMFIVSYSVLLLMRKYRGRKKIFWIFITIVSAFFVIILVTSKLFSEYYLELLRVRNPPENVVITAKTYIYSYFPYSNVALFMLNYVVNAVRMIFPIELLLKGFNISYYLFFVYQVITIVLFFRFLKYSENRILIGILIAFYMTSFAFEPDFGSFTRHQSTLIFFFLDLIIECRDNANPS